MIPKPLCTDCGTEPKRYGHPKWCQECWLSRQPMGLQAGAATTRLERVPAAERRARVPATEWPPGRRWCAGCQSFRRLRDCSGSRCRACASAAAHGARILALYDLSPADYAKLLLKQGGRCAICRARPRSTRLAVDHDHRTGVVRGLLCKRCNHDLLGAAHDGVEILEAAIAYLLSPPAAGNWEPPEVTAAMSSLRRDPPPF